MENKTIIQLYLFLIPICITIWNLDLDFYFAIFIKVKREKKSTIIIINRTWKISGKWVGFFFIHLFVCLFITCATINSGNCGILI